MKREGKLKISFSNRFLYTLIALGIIAVLSVGVYAVGSVPNPGHAISELQKCDTDGQVLKMSGTSWGCGTDVSGDGSEDSRLIFSKIDQTHSGLGNTAGYAAIENDGGTYKALMILGRSQTTGGTRVVKLWDYLQVNGNLDTTGNLQVAGTISSGSVNPNPAIRVRHINGKSPTTDTDDTLYLNYGASGKGVNIGDSGTDHPLTVFGSITAGSFIYSSSDRALKTNIQPLQNSLDKVLKLQGVSFNLKSTGDKSIGFIAQDVEKVLPELVSGTEGNKAVAYGNIVAVLVEAIKEQQKQIDELKSQIQELKEN